jgi:hypothetical protein
VGLVLPGELKWLEWIVGSDWPEGDETAMRRCAEAWKEAGADVDELIEDLQATASRVLGTVEGDGAEAFRRYFATYIKTDPRYLPKLAESCEKLAKTLDGGATEIEYAKYMFIALLTVTAIEIINLIATAAATLGAGAAAIPAVETAAQISSRSIAQQLLVAIGKGAFRGVLENVLLDLGIQAVQIAEGHRDGVDWSETGAAALGGALGGAISGGAGFGMGEVPGLGEGAGDTAMSGMMRGAAREGIAEGISGVAGTAADAMIHGASLSAEDLAKGGTSGAFGGAVGGAKNGLDEFDTPDVDVPDFAAEAGDGSADAPSDLAGAGDQASADSAASASDGDGSGSPASAAPHVAGGGSDGPAHSASPAPSHAAVDQGPTRTVEYAPAYQQSHQGSASYGGDPYGDADTVEPVHHGTSLAGVETHAAPLSGTPHTSFAGESAAPAASGSGFPADGRTVAATGSFAPGSPAADGSSSVSPAAASSSSTSAAPAGGGPAAAGGQIGAGVPLGSGGSGGSGGAPRTPDDAARSAALAGGMVTGGSTAQPARGGGTQPTGDGLPVDDAAPAPYAADQSAQTGPQHDDGQLNPVQEALLAREFSRHAAATMRAAMRRVPHSAPHQAARATGPAEAAGHPIGDSPSPISESLPPHLHQVYVHSAETPAGRSLFPPAEQAMRDLAQRVPADPDRYIVDGHGDPEGMWAGERSLDAADVAKLIRNDPNWSGREIMLISDATGDGPESFATRLARELGVPVTAPDGLAWTDARSRVFSTFGPYDTVGTSTATWPPDGGWSIHNPDGTIAGTGRDAFAPGHVEGADPRPGSAPAGDGPPTPGAASLAASETSASEAPVRPAEQGGVSGQDVGTAADVSAAGGLRLAPAFAAAGVDRPLIEPAERDGLLTYLEQTPIVLAARGFDTDRLDLTGPRNVPMTFHTDGVWVWSGAVGHYLRHHDAAPAPDLVAHIRAQDFQVPRGDGRSGERAVSLVTGAPVAR